MSNNSSSSFSWTATTIKYLLIFFNILFVISGIILLAVGVSVKEYYSTYETFLDQQYFSAPNLLIAIGVIIFFIAFFGCCGALKKNYCMILTFSTLLILIFILEFAAGIAGYVLKNETAEYLTKTLDENIPKYQPNETTSEINLVWDTIQKEFSCCGVNGPQDWKKNTNPPLSEDGLPLSCCSPPVGSVGTFECNMTSGNFYKTGCVEAFGVFVKDHAYTIGGIGLGFAAIQILAILFSCHLSRKVRENYEFM